MKVMIMTDNPNLETGMGRVGKQLANGILKSNKHSVIYLGWFTSPDLPNKMPLKLYSTHNQFYGKDIFESVMQRERPQILITVGDPWMVDYVPDSQFRSFFKWIMYCPIDGEKIGGGIPEAFYRPIVDCDRFVAYNEYGRDAVLKSLPNIKNKLRMIYHGVETEIYHPEEIEKVEATKEKINLKDMFIFLCVARNQTRKNLPDLLKIFKLFLDKLNPEEKLKTYLWLHTYFFDNMGWNLDTIIKDLRLQDNICMLDKVAFSNNFLDSYVSEENLNDIYNIGDCFILLSSEGFGLPAIEAMACKKPCIFLDHSGLKCLADNDRALKVPVAFNVIGQHLTERPFPDYEACANLMLKIYKDPALRSDLANKAYDWAITQTWKSKAEEFLKVINEFENPMDTTMRLEQF